MERKTNGKFVDEMTLEKYMYTKYVLKSKQTNVDGKSISFIFNLFLIAKDLCFCF